MVTANDIKEVASGPEEGNICKLCNNAGGWEAAASSTSYFWKECDCVLLKKSENRLIHLEEVL